MGRARFPSDLELDAQERRTLSHARQSAGAVNSVFGLAAGLGGNDPMLRKANGAAWEP